MNLQQVLQAGRSGFIYTAVSISAAMLIGLALGRLIGVRRVASFLISTGTAICGGSAIAAVGPIANATDEEMAVSLGTVFVLNSVALLAFPAIGSALHLTQTQFGLWSALAIHDTSSVVGAAAKFGAVALAVGTTVKASKGAVDCSTLVAYSHHNQEQGAHSVALVHWVLLPCRSREHLRAAIEADLPVSSSSGHNRPYGHAFSHRNGAIQSNAAGSRNPTTSARSVAVGNRGAGLASVDSYGVDSPLNTNRNLYLLPLGPLARYHNMGIDGNYRGSHQRDRNKRQH